MIRPEPSWNKHSRHSRNVASMLCTSTTLGKEYISGYTAPDTDESSARNRPFNWASFRQLPPHLRIKN